MKKLFFSVITVCLISAMLLCSAFSTSAAAVVTVDFESGSYGFLSPGDLNANGTVAADDLVMLRKILLNTKKSKYSEVYAEQGADAKYADTNGDGKVNIIDLVRAKKCVGKTFINAVGVDGTNGMNVYGNVVFSGGLSQMLTADTHYQVTFLYKAEGTLKLTINGISNQVYCFEAPESDEWTTATYSFATAAKFAETSDIEVQICGNGVVDNIIINQTAVDNDLSDTWSNT